MDRRLFLWSIVAALAGFLFGFDTVVISGAEKKLQSLWDLSAVMHGLAMGSALWGTVLGSMVGGWPTDHFGRKKTLLWVGSLFLIGSLWSALTNEVYSFMVARFIGGIAIGISTVAAPLYISEISPPAHRGRLAGMFQFNIVFGILVAFGSNYLLAGLGENSWRWMLGVMAVPSVIYTLACLVIPESPRWLIARKGDRAQGEAVLKLIHPGASAAEIGVLADSMKPEGPRQTAGGFWSSRLKTPILLAFLIAFFNQLSGINAILYFAPRIFGMTGSENALAQSIGIGITNLIFTFVGLWLIDRLGRRTLLYIGSFGYILSLGLCATAFFTWAPQFRAASSAVDVKGAVDSLETANPARVAKMQEDLAKKKSALVAATAEPKSGATPVTLADDASPASVKAVANEVLSQSSKAAGSGGMMVLICIFAFIASHAIGQGAVIWVFISEIFPDRYRAAGQALGSATHWVFAAGLTTVFPLMMAKLAPGVVFLIFTGMMVLQLIWVKFMVPETKGVPLEEMEQKLGIR
ncbi:sugar porter family MFS transporter [Luteolibacter soli]|uniref:Sugar porter family MFS transporter n=1 Tax=Luteolibacter soli TaxID=3135280 RepID=A0ABU9ATQ1_9BACT